MEKVKIILIDNNEVIDIKSRSNDHLETIPDNTSNVTIDTTPDNASNVTIDTIPDNATKVTIDTKEKVEEERPRFNNPVFQELSMARARLLESSSTSYKTASELYFDTMMTVIKSLEYQNSLLQSQLQDIKSFLVYQHKNNLNILEKNFYLKSKTVFQFWTGDNELTPKRIENLNNFIRVTEMRNILIDKNNLYQYEIPYRPIHKAYKYLTAVHKSDYLRPYFGYFYGGGYMDIKVCFGSWMQSWKDLIMSPDNVYMNSHPNPDRGCVPHHLGNEIQDSHATLPSVAIFLSKQYNPIMLDWLLETEKILDERYDDLVKNMHIAANPYEHRDAGSLYPIEWNEIGSRILHRIVYEKYKSNCILTMPFLHRNWESYR